MLRLIVRNSCFMALLLLASFALAQTEFSADMVNTQKDNGVQAKIYFGKDKMRVESQDHNPRGGGAFIMNFTTQTSLVLMDQMHMYMEIPAQSQSPRAMTYSYFFRTGDVDNACGDWLGLARNHSGSCHKVGNETVNGRSTVKYEATNASGEASTFWLDPKLRFPVKWQGKNSGGELRNIQEGSQPASLFEVPSGYTKMDMGGMMQQHQ